MGDEEVGDVGLLLQAHEQREDFLLHDLVKGGGDFIANDDLRFRRQGAGDGNALLLAAGHFAGKPVDIAFVEFDGLEQLDHAPVAVRALEAEIEFKRPADDIAHLLARIEGRVSRLVNHLDAAQRILVAVLARSRGRGLPLK